MPESKFVCFYLKFSQMIAQELGHVSDDSNQVLLHVLVPHQLEVRLVLVLQSILVGFKVIWKFIFKKLLFSKKNFGSNLCISIKMICAAAK